MNEQRAVIQQMVDALDHADELLGGNDTLVMNGAAAGRWLLEQPAAQEPVGCMRCATPKKCAIWGCSPNTWPSENTTPPAAQPAPVQEPVAVVSGYYGGQCVVLPINPARLFNSGTAFYTAPPAAQKLWVGLTDEEAQWIYDNGRTPSGMMEMVEAKLKEKNA
jgi:hypothetical protein